ncbi:MAG TPA: HemK/PrmC family methyltransferase [Acidimicrobiales bacterium]|nr:HemK/PrmC family methyltransferase [Acidimicrobiales bacterium]
MLRPAGIDAATAVLAWAGFLAPEAEAAELAAAADDDAHLAAMVQRRTTGEPLAWITGTTTFCGETLRVDPGVYVPRPQTEPLARAAAGVLPRDGTAVDLCTGSGALAVVLARQHPDARVIGTDLDPAAVRCARANGVEAYEGDLAAAAPSEVHGQVDLVTAVVPYVPSEALHLLPRDVTAHEPRRALDGGTHGTAILVRAVEAAAGLLRPGGHLVLELGGDQDRRLGATLARLGFTGIRPHHDEDGDLRRLEARSPTHPGRRRSPDPNATSGDTGSWRRG